MIRLNLNTPLIVKKYPTNIQIVCFYNYCHFQPYFPITIISNHSKRVILNDLCRTAITLSASFYIHTYTHTHLKTRCRPPISALLSIMYTKPPLGGNASAFLNKLRTI